MSSLYGGSHPLEFQAIDNAVFNSVAQGVFRVIGGVRRNEHIWKLLQPRQQRAFNGFVPAVSVEYSFLSFEDIQRRAAQFAAFQRENKGLGIKKRTASSIDHERAVLHVL